MCRILAPRCVQVDGELAEHVLKFVGLDETCAPFRALFFCCDDTKLLFQL